LASARGNTPATASRSSGVQPGLSKTLVGQNRP
jgi:hypothetical protein